MRRNRKAPQSAAVVAPNAIKLPRQQNVKMVGYLCTWVNPIVYSERSQPDARPDALTSQEDRCQSDAR